MRGSGLQGAITNRLGAVFASSNVVLGKQGKSMESTDEQNPDRGGSAINPYLGTGLGCVNLGFFRACFSGLVNRVMSFFSAGQLMRYLKIPCGFPFDTSPVRQEVRVEARNTKNGRSDSYVFGKRGLGIVCIGCIANHATCRRASTPDEGQQGPKFHKQFASEHPRPRLPKG